MTEIAARSWVARLRALTPARVGLGRTGVSQRTREQLDFQRAHALARDAVHAQLEAAALMETLRGISGGEVVRLHSMAPDRATYLQRPDLGRRLDERSHLVLTGKTGGYDLAIVIADGLSALAVERHAAPLLRELTPCLEGWRLAPISVIEQGRVAIGDEVGAVLGAELCVVLIGERPGLSAPDSLGAYVTWAPQAGRTDAERNCISNIRAEGLSYAQAAAQLVFYLTEARRRKLTGVALKESSHRIGGETTCCN
jgi:ethanolamine ammonia-lyase small subunit